MPNICVCLLEKLCQILLHSYVLISIIKHTKKVQLHHVTAWHMLGIILYTEKKHSLVQFVYNTEVKQ